MDKKVKVKTGNGMLRKNSILVHVSDDLYNAIVSYANEKNMSLSSAAAYILESRLFLLGHLDNLKPPKTKGE